MARWLLGLALLCIALQALAQADPPGRVARLNAYQGTVSFSPAGDDSWYDAVPNRPLTTGDRLWTDRNARAELFVGSAALRLDSNTAIGFSALDDQTLRITVQQGSVQLRVRDDLAGQRVELSTDNLAFVVQQPGDYRLRVDPQADLTQIMVASGAGIAYGENGESAPLASRQQLAVTGRNLALASGSLPGLDDAFERWVGERNRAEDASVSARYVSREVVGYQQLDTFGDWLDDSSYGPVWFPRNVGADWAPYSDGRWVYIVPWGWTWVDNAPWGFAPFHYGRWAQIGPRWGWVPGRQRVRPVYAPALVAFIGGGPGGSTPLAIGGGRTGIGWFPLAPGETWRPSYRASPRYVEQVNRMALFNQAPQSGPGGYLHQRPQAVTAVPVDLFGRGPIGRRDHVRLPDGAFHSGAPAANTAAIPLPPPHFAPGIGSAPRGFVGRPATALPPPMPWPQHRAAPAPFQPPAPQAMSPPREAAPQPQPHALPAAPPPMPAMPPQPQEALRRQQEMQQQRAQQDQARQQMHLQQQQQQQAVRQQQEMQQHQALQAQQRQQQMELQQQRAAQQQAQAAHQQRLQQQQAIQQQQAAQAQAMQQQAQQQALRQQQMQQQQLQMQQRAQQQQQQMQQQAAQQQQHQQRAAPPAPQEGRPPRHHPGMPPGAPSPNDRP